MSKPQSQMIQLRLITPVIEVVLEKAIEETVDAEKGEDVVKDVDEEVAKKEKGEKKDDQASVIVVRDTVADKGKYVVTD